MDNNSILNNMMEMALGLSMVSVFMRAMNKTADNVIPVATNRDMFENLLGQKYKYIYAILDGKISGPFSFEELVKMIESGVITRDTYLWKGGMPDWAHAAEVSDISPLNMFPPKFTPSE